MPVTATEAPPEIDNLYLDMNGIIHNCTHANDPNLKLTETEMVLRIFNYLDKLIQIMKPKQLVFLAIDGAWTSLLTSAVAYVPLLRVELAVSWPKAPTSLLRGCTSH